MPQWKDVDVNFRGSAASMGDAIQGIATGSKGMKDLANTIEAQKRYEAEQARQKVLDDRAATLFGQQQEDRSRALKDRESRIMLEGLKAELLPHLQAQDSSFADNMLPVLNRSVDSTVGMATEQGAGEAVSGIQPVTVTTPTFANRVVDLPRPNPEIAFATKDKGQPEKLPEKSTFRQVVEGMLPLSGVGNIMKVGSAILPDPAVTKLLETPGMYKTVPGSSVRELTTEGKAALAKGEIPGQSTTRTLTTNLDSIDFSMGYDTRGKPFTPSSKGDSFFRDTQTGKLVNEKAVTRAIAGVDLKPQKIETVVGTKTSEVPGLTKALTTAFRGGSSPKEVQAVGQSIKDNYAQVLNTLPKDNTTRREELRGYLTMMASNLGIDPKEYDVSKEVDSILPKTEVSDSQRIYIDKTLSSLDKELEQINKNRDYNLQERKFAADNAMDMARLALQRQQLAQSEQHFQANLAESRADRDARLLAASLKAKGKEPKFSSVYGSSLLKGLEEQIGSSDAERAFKAADAIQREYGLSPESTAALLRGSITTRSVGDSNWNPKQLQDSLTGALYAKRAQELASQYGGIDRVPSSILTKEKNSIINNTHKVISPYE